MAMIYGYFDESGKKSDHPVVTFSGVCGAESQIHSFDSAWNSLLRKYELPYLRMATASRTSRSLSSKIPAQPPSERVQSLKPFAECINEHLEVGLIQALDVNGFNAMSKNARAGLGSVDDPYFIAFTRALLELAHYAQGDDRISLICDDDAETAWDCYRHYRGVRRVHDLAREKIVSLSFADDKHFPALQAADMVSFLARLEAKSQFYQIPYSFNVLLRYLIPEVQNQKMIWKVMLKNKREMIDLSDALEGKKRRP